MVEPRRADLGRVAAGAAGPQLVGLYSPRAGSGKSVVADYLVRSRGFVNVKFSGPLKSMTRGLLGAMAFDPWTVERMIEGDLKEEVIPGFQTVTPRQIMVTLGTDWGREAIDLNLWIDVARRTIVEALERGRSVVVDDMRFLNEFDLIGSLGGLRVRLDRPDPSRVGGAKGEGLLDGLAFDRTIANDGTVGDLHQSVAYALARPV